MLPAEGRRRRRNARHAQGGAGSTKEGTGDLQALLILFLRLGVTAFGGPAAHIAMMEDEVVRRRQWLTSDEFVALIGATNLIPGPNSTEMALHIGHQRAGWRGLLVAGVAFILPAASITGALAWAYVRFGTLPTAGAILYGVKAVVVAVVVQALFRLAPSAAKTTPLRLLGVAATIGAATGLHELLLLALAGVAAMALDRQPPTSSSGFAAAPLGTAIVPLALAAPLAIPFSLAGLFLVFAKIGAVLFGSGYVLLAFLRTDLVERLHWLTEAQLLDAVAVGQVTPGPLFTTATFIGYMLGGGAGAVVATVGIFLPAFVFVALSGVLLPRLRRSRAARAFLDGVNVASLALMAVVTVQLARSAIVDALTALIGLASAVLLLRFRVNSTWLIAGGALGGMVALAFR
jgi:chromate transporter